MRLSVFIGVLPRAWMGGRFVRFVCIRGVRVCFVSFPLRERVPSLRRIIWLLGSFRIEWSLRVSVVLVLRRPWVSVGLIIFLRPRFLVLWIVPLMRMSCIILIVSMILMTLRVRCVEVCLCCLCVGMIRRMLLIVLVRRICVLGWCPFREELIM